MAETKTKPDVKPDRSPLLSLDTLVERRFVLIDGDRHELRNAAELSILDYHRIGRQGERVQKMMEQDGDLTDEQVQDLRGLLDSMCKVILLAPAEIHARLTDQHRLAVIHVFTQLQREGTATAPTAGDDPAPTSTGVSKSPV